jgi:hypothetical protein
LHRDPSAKRFASRVFRGAAIYGVLVLLPLYFVAVPDPYRLTQLGFAGVALAFQGVLWIIGSKPLAYRAFIPMAVLEKLSFGIPAVLFFALGRADPLVAGFGAIDLLLAALFVLAMVRLHRLTA